ncbi:MAG: DUF4271 domain-containing protein [Marinilabiliaceae bacterium]
MTTTFSAIVQQTETTVRADSLRRVERKASQVALRKKLQADEEDSGISHADSLYLRPSCSSFEDACVPASDIATAISPSGYQASYLRMASRADSLAASEATVASVPTAQTVVFEPTPRGHAPLRPYGGAVVISFLAVVLALSIMRMVSRAFLGDLFGFFTGSIGWKRLEGSQFVQKNLCFALVDSVYALMLAVVAVEAALVFCPDVVAGIGVYQAVGFAALFIACYYLGRFIVDSVVCYAFRIDERMRDVAIHRRAACGITGMLLAPCALAMPFVSADGCLFLTATAAFVIIAVSLVRLSKVIRINMTSLPTILYFILYLCTVEAAPLVCLARLATMVFPVNLLPS